MTQASVVKGIVYFQAAIRGWRSRKWLVEHDFTDSDESDLSDNPYRHLEWSGEEERMRAEQEMAQREMERQLERQQRMEERRRKRQKQQDERLEKRRVGREEQRAAKRRKAEEAQRMQEEREAEERRRQEEARRREEEEREAEERRRQEEARRREEEDREAEESRQEEARRREEEEREAEERRRQEEMRRKEEERRWQEEREAEEGSKRNQVLATEESERSVLVADDMALMEQIQSMQQEELKLLRDRERKREKMEKKKQKQEAGAREIDARETEIRLQMEKEEREVWERLMEISTELALRFAIEGEEGRERKGIKKLSKEAIRAKEATERGPREREEEQHAVQILCLEEEKGRNVPYGMQGNEAERLKIEEAMQSSVIEMRKIYTITRFQANVRGFLTRKRLLADADVQAYIGSSSDSSGAHVHGPPPDDDCYSVRRSKGVLDSGARAVIALQAATRGFLTRKRLLDDSFVKQRLSAADDSPSAASEESPRLWDKRKNSFDIPYARVEGKQSAEELPQLERDELLARALQEEENRHAMDHDLRARQLFPESRSGVQERLSYKSTNSFGQSVDSKPDLPQAWRPDRVAAPKPVQIATPTSASKQRSLFGPNSTISGKHLKPRPQPSDPNSRILPPPPGLAPSSKRRSSKRPKSRGRTQGVPASPPLASYAHHPPSSLPSGSIHGHPSTNTQMPLPPPLGIGPGYPAANTTIPWSGYAPPLPQPAMPLPYPDHHSLSPYMAHPTSAYAVASKGNHMAYHHTYPYSHVTQDYTYPTNHTHDTYATPFHAPHVSHIHPSNVSYSQRPHRGHVDASFENPEDGSWNVSGAYVKLADTSSRSHKTPVKAPHLRAALFGQKRGRKQAPVLDSPLCDSLPSNTDGRINDSTMYITINHNHSFATDFLLTELLKLNNPPNSLPSPRSPKSPKSSRSHQTISTQTNNFQHTLPSSPPEEKPERPVFQMKGTQSDTKKGVPRNKTSVDHKVEEKKAQANQWREKQAMRRHEIKSTDEMMNNIETAQKRLAEFTAKQQAQADMIIADRIATTADQVERFTSLDGESASRSGSDQTTSLPTMRELLQFATSFSNKSYILGDAENDGAHTNPTTWKSAKVSHSSRSLTGQTQRGTIRPDTAGKIPFAAKFLKRHDLYPELELCGPNESDFTLNLSTNSSQTSSRESLYRIGLAPKKHQKDRTTHPQTRSVSAISRARAG